MKNYVHSFWSKSPPPARFDSLKSELKADVIVIGGGMNGICVALALRKSGHEVVSIDRGSIGAQSSTKNFGILTTVWDYSGHWAEGVVFRLLANTPMRSVANAILKP